MDGMTPPVKPTGEQVMRNDTVFDQTFECGIRAVVVPDDSGDVESPRENDTVGRMVCAHRRYELGDSAKKLGFTFRADDYNGWDGVETMLREEEDAFVILPLALVDHGGISMSVGRGGGWDSGQVGFIYATRKSAVEGWPELAGDDAKLREAVEACLRSEVEEYDAYLRGEVYGYIVYDVAGEVLDSCWGFIGESGCEAAQDDAIATAKYHVKQAQPRQEEYRQSITAARKFLATCPPSVRKVAEEGLMLLAMREGV